MTKLGVNIDHIATVRQARREFDPDPIEGAKIAQSSGADSIVCHLREDRRHINDNDVKRLRRIVKKPLNLEMSLNPAIVNIALKIKPDYAMFVPEKRKEVTTEGGLNVIKNARRIKLACGKLQKKGIKVSLFIDPQKKQIDKAKEVGATIIELHTGHYANATTKSAKQRELKRLQQMAVYAKNKGLIVHAGHGLKYHDVRPVAKIKAVDELNIGHAIISRAVFTGLANAVKDMKRLVK